MKKNVWTLCSDQQAKGICDKFVTQQERKRPQALENDIKNDIMKLREVPIKKTNKIQKLIDRVCISVDKLCKYSLHVDATVNEKKFLSQQKVTELIKLCESVKIYLTPKIVGVCGEKNKAYEKAHNILRIAA